MNEPIRTRPWFYVPLALTVMAASAVPAAAAVALRRPIADEFLYNGMGMIAAAIASALIAIGMIVLGVLLLTNPALRTRRGILIIAFGSLLAGPLAGASLYAVNCLLEC